MAIEFRAAGTADKGAGALAPGLPTGHVLNDILILVVHSSNETISAPSGYAEVTSASPQGTGTAATAGSTRLAIFWKRDNGSESGPTVADSGNHTVAQIFAFSGCITTGDPWDVNAGDVDAAGTNTAVVIPAVTTTVANTMIIAAVAHAIDSNSAQGSSESNANLTEVAEQGDVSTNSNTGGGFVVITGKKASIGSTGTTADTLASASKQARICIALKPPGNNLYTEYYRRLIENGSQ